jgi:hypothetical protein
VALSHANAFVQVCRNAAVPPMLNTATAKDGPVVASPAGRWARRGSC